MPQVHCYDPLTGNLWVHHDIALGAFPLCTAFLDVPPLGSGTSGEGAGAYVAVGTFKPGIEVWNLDVLDPLEPSALLGGHDPRSGGKNKSGKKGRKGGLSLKADSHTDAVMGLAWNRLQRQVHTQIGVGRCFRTSFSSSPRSLKMRHFVYSVLSSLFVYFFGFFVCVCVF